jgi:hypothetical protein
MRAMAAPMLRWDRMIEGATGIAAVLEDMADLLVTSGCRNRINQEGYALQYHLSRLRDDSCHGCCWDGCDEVAMSEVVGCWHEKNGFVGDGDGGVCWGAGAE